MAKTATKGRRSARAKGDQEALPTMEDLYDVPESVQEAADAYKKTSVAKANAGGKFNGARDRLIDQMRENGIDAVRIDIGGGKHKILELSPKDTIKETTPKKPKDESDE